MARLSFRSGKAGGPLACQILGGRPRSTVGEPALLIGTIVLPLRKRIGGREARVA